MDSQVFADWLSGFSLPARINALSRIHGPFYSRSRPRRSSGENGSGIDKLREAMKKYGR
jgi:hypothetical protein